ncbi:MAG: hypothetical protein M1473_07650 [Firmicutes bacterium]|nr:hypothetical protein [Bacillota bacterium]
MAIRTLMGTPTTDAGVFWSDKLDHAGWRIQYNSTLEKTNLLKPYRLLDPSGNLWASSDTLEEMVIALPELTNLFSKQESLFTTEDLKRFVEKVTAAALPTK